MQQRELKRMHQTGEYTISDLGELFSVSRPTVYRTLSRTHPSGNQSARLNRASDRALIRRVQNVTMVGSGSS